MARNRAVRVRDASPEEFFQRRVDVPDKSSTEDEDEYGTVSTAVYEKAKIYVPDDADEVVDPRLKDYPIPLVAKTVNLHNNFDEPILTFRFFFLSTFWVLVGDAIATMYYFKPYSSTLTSYAVQLLSWGMGDYMAKLLPTRRFTIFGRSFSLNPGPWNAKEHALIVVSYWGSCYTAYGLGPLSALELYYDKKISPVWAIVFLVTTQMIGYGFAGLFRDILVRPPNIYYPGVLPNVALFNAMHRNPSVTKNSLRFFTYVACVTFVWQFLPGVIFPMLSSLPLLCYMTHGNWIGYFLGSGYYGFGMLDITLDWNFASFMSPLYTPLWANASIFAGAIFATWLLYPVLYFSNTLNAMNFPPMSSNTYDENGDVYNISRILIHPSLLLNQTAMDEYSAPHWSLSYAMYFFWGFACSTGALVYALLWYGKSSYHSIVQAIKGRRSNYNDPYLKIMEHTDRVPHWWYLTILTVCMVLSLVTMYLGDFELPWWGFFVVGLVSAASTFPNGILWGIANLQVGMSFVSELMAGAMFPGNPSAVLASMTFGRQILEQNLNLISDYKFGFYMKIPEKEMFLGQVYGTLLGPFINYGFMRLIIDRIGKKTLTGTLESNAWLALQSKNYYSLSVLWGVIGPKVIFSSASNYHWIYFAFIVGPVLVTLVYIVHRYKPHWNLETNLNPVVLMYGAYISPVRQSVNIFTSGMLALFFMGFVLRYRPVWFRKYNYLLGVGLDCGSQLCQSVIMLAINLTNAQFPVWWGNDVPFFDRCYPPATLPPKMLH